MITKKPMLYILILLIFLSSLSGLYGKNLPKYVWHISLLSAALLGFVLANLVEAPYPENILVGFFVSIGAALLVVTLRLPRRNHPR